MKILFFAKYRELLNVSELEIEKTEQIHSVADLKHYLLNLHANEESWQQVLTDKKLICAVNQEVAKFDQLVNHDDEIAFFPPVTGG